MHDHSATPAYRVPRAPTAFPESMHRVMDDGLRAYCSASWNQGSHLFSMFSASGSLRFSPTTAFDGSPAIAAHFTSAPASATGPNPEWIGKPIGLVLADTQIPPILTRVIDFYYDPQNRFTPTFVIEGPVPEGLDGSECRIACPCFTPADIGKRIWISDATHPSAGHGNPVAIMPFRSTIVRAEAPFAVEVADPITATSRTDQPGSLVVWGTDNSPGVRRAGKRATATGLTTITFGRSGRPHATGLACLFDWVPNHGPASVEEVAGSAAMAALQWVSVDCELLILSACGARGNEYSGGFQDTAFRKTAVSWNAPAQPPPAKGIVARQHFPRCATLNEIVVVVTGDSWAVTNSGGHAGNDHAAPIIEELIRQNPAKRIQVLNRAIGGSSWAWLNGRRQPSGPLPDWYSDPNGEWLQYIETVTLADGQERTPDLVLILMTGNNDSAPGGAIHRNDIASVIAKVRRWPAVNGLPPDVAMMCGGTKDVELFTPGGGLEAYYHAAEYVTGFLRSFARCNRIGLFDLGTTIALSTDGWAPEHLTLRQVPPLLLGEAGPTTPYSARYLCRDFYVAIRLGDESESGEAFWARTGGLSISLSQKCDNRLWLGPDTRGHLQVCAVSWGMPVPTSYAIDAASRQLTTFEHETVALPGKPLRVAAPGFGIWSDGKFRNDMVGKCLLIPAIGFQDADYRTTIQSITNDQNVFACDGNASATPARMFHVGGQMFMASDASAGVDILVGGAGRDNHLLTGSGTLVTRCEYDGFRDFRTVQIEAPPRTTLDHATGLVFVGAIVQAPTYDKPVQVAQDAGNGAILTVRVQGTRARVGYVRGGQKGMDWRTTLRNHESVVWEGEIERMGGPFVPRVWSTRPATVEMVDVWIGERSIFMPELTHREVWGVGDPECTWATGGDTSHMSQAGIRHIIGRIARTQDLSFG